MYQLNLKDMKTFIINFLVNNDILDQWINNFEKDVSWRNEEEIHEFLNINHDSYYINYAFNWENTEEGHDFWQKIDWRNHIHNQMNYTQTKDLCVSTAHA
jgi:hypothetical protein